MDNKSKLPYIAGTTSALYGGSALIRANRIPLPTLKELVNFHTTPPISIEKTINAFEKKHPKKVLFIDIHDFGRDKRVMTELRKLSSNKLETVVNTVARVSDNSKAGIPHIRSVSISKNVDAIIANHRPGAVALHHELGHLATNAKYKILDTEIPYRLGITTLWEERLANKNIPQAMRNKYKKEIRKMYNAFSKRGVLRQRGKAALLLAMPFLAAGEYYRTRGD